MNYEHSGRKSPRRGAIAVLSAVMMVLLLGLVALAVDYGLIVKVRSDLQRAADAAALAAVQDLVPAADGTQDLAAARATVQTYATSNLEEPSFQVAGGDIEIGRFEPATVYSAVTLDNSGILDAVRVTLRRDGTTNPRVGLFFGRVLGQKEAGVMATGTAVLQKAMRLEPGAPVLPFSMHRDAWNGHEVWSIYGDGKLKDANRDSIPGNWGTLDIGPSNNSTSDLSDQILDGLSRDDLAALYAEDRIPQSKYIDATEPLWLNGDPGLSSGMQSAVQAIHGEERIVPIYDGLGGELHGADVAFHIVGWGVVTVVDSHWGGSKKTHVKIKKACLYSGGLGAKPDLGIEQAAIEGAYTSPALVE